VIAFGAEAVVAQLVFQGVVDFVADGVELPTAIAGGQDEIVEFARKRPHVEDGDVLAAVVGSSARGGKGQLQAAGAARFKIGRGVGDGNSFEKLVAGDWWIWTKREGSILLGTGPADEWRKCANRGPGQPFAVVAAAPTIGTNTDKTNLEGATDG
jgi:hypothetical protein